MSIRDEKNIKVLNYNETKLCFKSNIRSYVLPVGSIDEPTFEYITFDEIAYINSNTNGIKTGLIRFEPEIENEIYKELGIDKSKIIKNEEFEYILLNTTKEGIKKIIDITDESVFKRANRIFARLKNTGADISMNTARIMEQRMNEFSKGIISSNIKIYDEDIPKNKSEETIKLEREIEQLKSMISRLTKDKNNEVENIENKNIDNLEKSHTESKKGRPKKNI